jgi:hypothetical protein
MNNEPFFKNALQQYQPVTAPIKETANLPTGRKKNLWILF